MSLELKLDDEIKTAMKARDQARLACLRMVKSLVAEKRTAPGYTGGVTDELVLGVISSYSKKLAKTIEEVEKAGHGDNPILQSYRFEIELLKDWLPARMDEEATRAVIRQMIAEAGLSGANSVGRLTGMVMKAHRDTVDPVIVKKIAEEELAR